MNPSRRRSGCGTDYTEMLFYRQAMIDDGNSRKKRKKEDGSCGDDDEQIQYLLTKPLSLINNHYGDRSVHNKNMDACQCLLRHCEKDGSVQTQVAQLIEDVRQYTNAHYPTPELFKDFMQQYVKGLNEILTYQRHFLLFTLSRSSLFY